MGDKKEARADGGRRFQREGPAAKKNLNLAIGVLVRETKSSRLSRERRGRYTCIDAIDVIIDTSDAMINYSWYYWC